MKYPRKEIFQKLRSWIKKAGVSFDVVLSEQKAALPNSAAVVIDPLQIFSNVGHMSKTKPVFETGDEVLLIDKISEHQIEAVVYFLDSLDGKQDSSGEFLKLLADLQDNAFDRFDKSKTEAISVLKAQQVNLSLDTNGAEYRRTYALRLVLLLSVLWKTNSDPIESMDLSNTFYKPTGEVIL